MLNKYFNFNNSQPQLCRPRLASGAATFHITLAVIIDLPAFLTIYGLHYMRSAENYYTTYSARRAYL